MDTRRSASVVREFLGAPSGVASLILLAVLVALAVPGADGYGSAATEVSMDESSQGPSDGHWFGTDGLGRDIALRTLAATRMTLVLGVSAVAIAVVAGCLIGALLAYSPPIVRKVGATGIDVMLTLGEYLLAIVVVTILGIGAQSAVIAIGIAMTPGIARFVFTLVSSVSARDYVAAAQVLGVPRRGILRRYIFPNTADSLVVTVSGRIGEGIVALSSLSFLGLGVQSPDFDWGLMLTDGVRSFYLNPWAALVPATMILVTGLTLAMLGDALARASNPILRGQVGAPAGVAEAAAVSKEAQP
jgi:ABC-type dipeptide/oligopeptide/nickel transport system permease subunit